jgi:hypothetical protein
LNSRPGRLFLKLRSRHAGIIISIGRIFVAKDKSPKKEVKKPKKDKK